MKKYDFILNGGGAAGLSLAMHFHQNSFFKDKKILIIDAEKKSKNDRTFCIWKKNDILFEPIISKKWNKINFLHPDFEKNIDLKEYQYAMIEGKNFYEYVFKNLYNNPNIDFLQTHSKEWGSTEEGAWVNTDKGFFEGQWLFNSIFNPKTEQKKGYHYYLQHFKGWIIETKKPVFDDLSATFMDFRLPQRAGEACFMYLLPTSPYKSLVEYTLFGTEILSDEEYENIIQKYIAETLQLNPTEFEIKETEFGIIPMYDEPFQQKQSSFVMNIGTAGGATKASTGFTFHNIQKQCEKIIENLIKKNTPFYTQKIFFQRFNLYDAILLEVMQKKALKGADIFKIMFEKHQVQKIFRFLDNESNFLEELQIMASVPSKPFTQAFFNLMKKRFWNV
jgi:lycopene beta-cyclase